MLSGATSQTLIGTMLTMTGTSSTTTGSITPSVAFGGTVTVAKPDGSGQLPGQGVPVPLVAYCAYGPVSGSVVTTATGGVSGTLAASVNLVMPQCVFRWEIYDSTAYMGGLTPVVRLSAGGIVPPVVPPRGR
jgi:hypothetical protein